MSPRPYSLVCSRLARVAFVTVFTVGGLALADEKVSGDPMAPMGSPSYVPSPDRPVGWRGDGTGRFPAANPPTQWGRTVKGFYAQLQCQAGRPQGPAKAGDLLNMGFLRDWVILGPFDAKEFKSGVDENVIDGETTIEPRIGDAAGGQTWTHWRISVENQSKSDGKLLLDFAQAYGRAERQERQNFAGSMQPWVAYAQTGLWSPVAAKVRLRIEGDSTRKAWFNGESVKMPGQWDPSPMVDLKQGWNNLVVKAVSTKSGWNFAVHVAPAPPYDYETKNIRWMTRMPGPSWCSPIIVGDRVFVSADGGTLVCINKADGRVLWMRSTTYYHAIGEEERSKFAGLEQKVKQLDEACERLPAMINKTVSPDGMAADADDALKRKIKEKCDLERAIQTAMGEADKGYRAWDNDADWSKYNPTSDGRHVWAVFWGGNKGIGANVVVCFDLEGNRVWSYFCGQTDIPEHGTHSSPALCGDYLVFKTGKVLFGFEKATGKVAWRQELKNAGIGASTVPVRLGNEVLAYVPQAGLYRPSDGTLLWKAPVTADIPTPTINDGVIYGIGSKDYFAFRLPKEVSNPITLETLVKVAWKDVAYQMPGVFTNTIIGSPLYDNGLIYLPSEGGAMNVIDATTGKRVYAQPMESLNPRLTWVFKVGICSSTALGGKYVLVHDDQGQTLVLQPGREYKELAKNLLVEYDERGMQPEVQSNFYFEGRQIYFRTRGFLYCISDE